MKFNRSRSWPHPVLSPLCDDIYPNDFDFKLEVSPEYKRWLLEIDATDSDRTLHQYIANNKAHYLLQVECKRTYFRQAFTSQKPKFDVQIEGDLLFGSVEVSLLVVTAVDLSKYQHPNQHDDYGANTFSLSIGEPLAVAQSKSFDAFLEADPVLKLSSILDIQLGESDLKVMKVNCRDDRIVVELPAVEFERYRDLRADPNSRGLLTATVVMPALLDGLFYLRTPDLDLDEFKATHRWSRCILRRLEILGVDILNPNTESGICLEAAQILLREPLRRSLEDLKEFLSMPLS